MKRDFDIIVVGAGPAGLAAATAAAKCGHSVAVLDDNPHAGGQIWRKGVAGKTSKDDRARVTAIATSEASGAVLLAGRRVVDIPEHGRLRVVVEQGSGHSAELFRWKCLILATGARERFLPFPGWTLPGVCGAGGLQALVKGGTPIAGKSVVVAGTGPLLLAVAAHLKEYGAKIVSVAEQASFGQMLPFALSLWRSPGKVVQGAQFRVALAGVPYRIGCWPVSALGGTSLESVTLTDGEQSWTEACDYLACGFHLIPNTELAQLLGCTLQDGLVVVDREQRTSVADVFCAGEPTGIAGVDAARVQGEIAGFVAAGETSRAARLFGRRDRERGFGKRLSKAFELRSELRTLPDADTIVCRCEDVRYSRLQGRSGWTDAKLHTRCGMGPCQGRICGGAVETLFGWRPVSVRPPIFPISIADCCDAIDTSTDFKPLQETL